MSAADEAHSQPNDVEREATIKEEYQLWRKNCRYMYEFVSETALTWPSITFQWLPDHQLVEKDGLINSRILLGTHTSGEDTNYLKVSSTQLPLSSKDLSSSENSPKVSTKIKITEKLRNNFEINRARYLPQSPNIVASINGEGEIDLYHLSEGKKEATAHWKSHEANGYGLAWNNYKKGYLLTGSDDRSVIVTDVERANDGSGIVMHYKDHGDIVNDAKWHHFDENLFASASDDEYLRIFDLRTQSAVSSYKNSGTEGINCVSFSPFSSNLVATGNTNSNICLFDLRKMSSNPEQSNGLLHTMMGHSDSITSLEFSPHKDGIIASGSQDRRVIIWDLHKIGEEQVQEDAEDGCPELFMMHAGHTGAVNDLGWCPYKEWVLGSVADDNIVHLWEVSKSILNSDEPLNIPDKLLE